MPSLPLDDENLPLYTVGQVAAALRVQHAFLRRLDDFGVVSPSRSSGGQRRYTRQEVTVVAYVQRLAEDGMTLAAIRRVLRLEGHIRQLEDQILRLENQVRELEAERAGLRAAVDERDQLVARLRPFSESGGTPIRASRPRMRPDPRRDRGAGESGQPA